MDPRDESQVDGFDFRQDWRKFTLAGIGILAGVLGSVLVSIILDQIWGVDWTAVAAVAGVLAAIATAIAVMVFWYLTRKQLRQDREHFDAERSEITRAAVREFASVTAGVCRQIIDGYALISMCWLTAELMVDVARRGVHGNTSATALRDRLHNLVTDKDGPFLSLWVRGAETSPSASTLIAETATLPFLAERMRGELGMASPLAKIVVAMVEDIRMVFVAALKNEDPTLREAIVNDYLQGHGEADLLSGLARSLHENLSSYVLSQHEKPARTIKRIVTMVTYTCHDITPEQLLAASRTNVQTPPSTLLTQDVRALAERFFQRASNETKVEALRLIDDLAEQIAKPQ